MKPILEHIPSTSGESLFFGHYEQTSFTFPWHYHPQWELTYIIKGTGSAYTGNSIRHFNSGELVLVAPNTPHCWKSNTSDNNKVKSVFVQWDNSFLGSDWLAQPEFSSIGSLFEQCRSGLAFSLPINSEIPNTMQGLRFKSPFKRVWHFTDLLYEISQLEKREIGYGGKLETDLDKSGRIKDILNYVNQYYGQPITSKEMASITKMTPVSFSKYFSQTFGKPFTRFLNEYRVSQACNMLVASHRSVDEIAFLSGYQNMSFFHRQFKLIVGKTPLQFRESYSLD